jgi:hypothetical protein
MIILSPVLAFLGHTPSQAVKCLTVGQWLMSTPISVSTSMPSMAIRSTPTRWESSLRRSKAGSWCRLMRGQQRDGLVHGGDFDITGRDLLAEKVVGRQRLTQGENVLAFVARAEQMLNLSKEKIP